MKNIKMKFIKLFEEFDQQTLIKNISAYNSYLKNEDRSKIVAWNVTNSQEKNFKLISDNINKDESLLDFGCGIGDLINYLNKNDKLPSKYMGLDININYINMAKNNYPDYNFMVIDNIKNIKGNYDNVCAIGVFTWFITKKDFIDTINKLYELSNKKVLITTLYSSYINIDRYSWDSEYRYYNKKLIKKLFPNFNIKFKIKNNDTMLIEIIK